MGVATIWVEISCDLCLKPTGIRVLHLAAALKVQQVVKGLPTLCNLCYKADRFEVEREFIKKHEKQRKALEEMIELLDKKAPDV